MNRIVRYVLCTVVSLFLPLVPLASAKAKKKARVHTAARTSHSHQAQSRAKGSSRASHRPTGRSSRRSKHSSQQAGDASRASWRTRQSSPSSDRYREIQSALAAKGYLKSEPTGTWDADSQDAMRRFQADQKLEQTGKVNSLSLISLGLGPSHTPTSEVTAIPPAPPK